MDTSHATSRKISPLGLPPAKPFGSESPAASQAESLTHKTAANLLRRMLEVS